MPFPPLHSISQSQFYSSGNIFIDPTAAIAPGVVLQADPSSKIIIAAGVCIGMGSIIHAHGGTLKIESGAILGAGVLVVGQGHIGVNACIGSCTTLYNTNLKSGEIVAPGILLTEVVNLPEKNPNQELANQEETPIVLRAEKPVQEIEIKAKEPEIENIIEQKKEPEKENIIEQEKEPEKENIIEQKKEPEKENIIDDDPWLQDTSIKSEIGENSGLSQVVLPSDLAVIMADTQITGTNETESNSEENSPVAVEYNQSLRINIHGKGNLNRLLTTLFPHRQ
ncbi:MAG TPA: hypothetical protein V6C58_15475 [Allocoleopsis sp.]